MSTADITAAINPQQSIYLSVPVPIIFLSFTVLPPSVKSSAAAASVYELGIIRKTDKELEMKTESLNI